MKEIRPAAAAFYWAARINPGWGEPLYARRAALIMRDRGLRKKYFERIPQLAAGTTCADSTRCSFAR